MKTRRGQKISKDLIARMITSKVVYTAVFLTPQSRGKLLQNFPAIHERVEANHMTIKFAPSDKDVQELSLGEEVKLHVIGYAEDDRGQAVKVESQIKSANSTPHITISVANGTKPVYSNELLKNGVQPVSGITLTGIVDTYPRSI